MRAWSEAGDRLPHAHSLFVAHRRKTHWSLETGTQQLTHMVSLQATLTNWTVPATYFLLSSGHCNFAVQQHLHQQGHWTLLTGKGIELRFPIQWKCGTAITETNSLYSIFKWIQDCQCITDGNSRTALLHRSARRFKWHLLYACTAE